MYRYEIITPIDIDVGFVYKELMNYFSNEYIVVTSGMLYLDGNTLECKIFGFVGKALYYEDILSLRRSFEWYKIRYYKVKGVIELIKTK